VCEAKGQEELLEGYFGQQHFSSFSTNFRVREVGLINFKMVRLTMANPHMPKNINKHHSRPSLGRRKSMLGRISKLIVLMIVQQTEK